MTKLCQSHLLRLLLKNTQSCWLIRIFNSLLRCRVMATLAVYNILLYSTLISGVVLGRDGGMIQQTFLPFFMGLGGRIGSGRQYFPWIHVADIASIITFSIMNEQVTGVLNGVAPEIVTNEQFTKAFGAAFSVKRPTILPVPGTVMNWVYGPERGKIILEGQKVIPKRTLELGYKYLFPDLKSACEEFARLSVVNYFG